MKKILNNKAAGQQYFEVHESVLFLLMFPQREVREIQPQAPLGEESEPALLSPGGKVLREALCPAGDLIWKDTGAWVTAPGGGLIESFVARGGSTKMSKKKVTYFSFETKSLSTGAVGENSWGTFLSDSSTFVSALKLYLAKASPISPGCAGGGGLAGCAFSGGMSFCKGKQGLRLDLW